MLLLLTPVQEGFLVMSVIFTAVMSFAYFYASADAIIEPRRYRPRERDIPSVRIPQYVMDEIDMENPPEEQVKTTGYIFKDYYRYPDGMISNQKLGKYYWPGKDGDYTYHGDDMDPELKQILETINNIENNGNKQRSIKGRNRRVLS